MLNEDELRDAVLLYCAERKPCKYSGFNVETVEYKNISFTVWDVGGQDKVEPFQLCIIS